MNGGVAGLNWRRSLAALGMVSLAGACNSSPPPGEPPGAVEVVTSPSMQRFVAFRQSALTLEALETPTVPPVTVGSTVSADLLTTSDSGVVGIDAAGNLIGHRNGTATIRSQSGSLLAVTVDAVASIRLEPEHLVLAAGQQTTVHVWAGDHEIAAGALRWDTTNPNTSVASGTTVYAGYIPGEATLTARSGAATATLQVRVRPARFTLRVRPAGTNLKRGDLTRLAVNTPPGLGIEWSSSNSQVLEPLRDGAYHARARGTADACATAGGQTSCARIQVR